MDGDRLDDEDRTGALEVPLRPVPVAPGGQRRAGAVLSAAVGVVAVALALAALPPKAPATTADSTPNDGFARVPTPSRSAAVVPSPSVARPQPSSARHEALPSLLNQPMAGAPTVGLVERQGSDTRILAWTPGDALTPVRTFAGVFSAESQIAVVSPDGASVVVATVHPGGEDGVDTARLVFDDGEVAWEGDGITAIRGITWSSDSTKVALVGKPGTWWVVSIDPREGVVSERIVLGGSPVASTDRPSAGPSGGAPPATVADPELVDLVPVGFSADGQWLYGAPTPPNGGPAGPPVRVSIPDGAVESISDYATRGPARLSADDGNRGIDPTTGRAIRFGANASIPGGPPTVEVTEADGSLAYRIESGVVLGAVWQADGELLILEADGFPFPTRLRLLPIGRDGTLGLPALTTGPVAWGGLIGTRNGFAVLAFGTQQPSYGIQLVVVDLADGTAAGLTFSADEMNILGASLLP